MIRGRRLAVLAAAHLLLAGSLANATASSRPAHRPLAGPDVKSSSVLIWDETHSSVLYSKGADKALPIASITKLMTTLVVLDAELPMDEVLKVTNDDRAQGKGTHSRLAVGTKLTRSELIRLALMSSENRAAHALARTYPGGVPACVAAMNAKAKVMSMASAHFVDPTGLSSDNVANPQDLTLLVRTAAQNPIIREHSTGKEYAVRVGRKMLAFHNTNSLVGNSAWDITVQKTGYISEAGRCLVMQAVISGRTVTIVLLNSVGKYTRVADARRIKKWLEARLGAGGDRMAAAR